jgi:oxygen-independent coproporphyrinogen-3 oxidase
MTALYVHIPFCVKKCAYCDFASYAGRERDEEAYVRALLREAKTYAGERIETVFVGGGTPSLLPAYLMRTLLSGLKDIFRIAPDAEWTVECNPGTVDPEKLRAYRECGVNRLSFGAQAAQESLLDMLGRIHKWEDAASAVRMARDEGFHNVNVDLMYALPGQTMADWRGTLEKAVSLGVKHISAYSLIVEEGTPIAEEIRRGELTVPDEDAALQMQHFAQAYLAKAGLYRYEISNYAAPGFECRHNVVYWTRGDYIGLGCAAHSFYRAERYHNPDGLDEYLSGMRGLDRGRVTREEAREEALMLGTRMTQGVSLQEYAARYGEDLLSVCGAKIERLRRLGLVLTDGGRLRLTEKGMDVQDAVVLELLP